jgi:crotonobetainyl-CoA:carnitine CoA-transferase CaiB-like acyl-CoA transferase
MQPLEGVLVLDFSTLLPGPLATLMRAEAGAQVIKVERPGGEEMRRFGPFWEGESATYALLNRGKEILPVDLKDPADRGRLDSLLQRADILVEQFRPDVMDRLGLGYEALREKYPRLIYCSISGYGQTGPRAHEAGHDINYISNAGVLALQAEPRVPPMLAADIAGGSFPAVINILLALRARDKSGKGCRLDIAMTDAMFTFAWYALAIGQARGQFPGPGELRLAGGSPRYQIYRTKDGRFIACGALEEKFWQAFTRAIGLAPQLIDDSIDPKATLAAVSSIIAGKTAQHWKPILAQADCCATMVVPLEEAICDPHFTGRGLFGHFLESATGKKMPALPVAIDPQFRDPAGTRKKAPPPED